MQAVQRRTFTLSTPSLSPVDRRALRARFDEAVAKINPTRGGRLTTEFYAKTGDAVFTAGCAALDDHCTGKKRMHTLSAPAGAGKTSFSYALIAAVTREAEENPAAPFGCVFVVDQIERADTAYRELSELLPGKVAVWTSEHDVGAKEWPKLAALGKTPAARFDKAALRHYPVAVVTHKLFLGNNGYHAVDVVRDGRFNPGGRRRALTLIDEQPREAVAVLDLQLSQAAKVREKLLVTHPHIKEPLDNLLRFMERYHYVQSNRLYRPGIEIDRNALNEQLAWFGSREADTVLKSVAGEVAFANDAEDDQQRPDPARVFRFANLLRQGFGYTACENNLVWFLAWENRLVDKLNPGTILLDATADIDGVSRIVPWMTPIETPQAHYNNLEIVHVQKLTKQNLKSFLASATGLRAYQRWMVQTILDNTQPGQKVLVVCHKQLIAQEYIPNWPRGDEGFQQPEKFTTKYGWQLEGRHICVTHWGTGIGNNAWKDAEVVVLCGEFHLPQRVVVANTQGYREHRAHEGDLGAMSTLRSSAPNVDAIANGHLLRWFKQMALRGTARHYDAQGMCGRQRLVIACELDRLLANVGTLFPGAKPPRFSVEGGRLADKVLAFLNDLPASAAAITTAELGNGINRKWGTISKKLLTAEFLRSLEAIGWRYVSVKGRGGSRFERVPEVQATPSTAVPLVAAAAQPTQGMVAAEAC